MSALSENHIRTTSEHSMQAAQVLQTPMEVLESSLYTFREVQITLAKYKGSIVPPSTLRRWISQLGIESDEFGCYSREDLTILARLIFWLKRGRTIQTFAQIIQKELKINGY